MIAQSTPAGAPDDARATEFQAVDANSSAMNGETLLVQAYAALWLLVFFAIAWIWRRQAKQDAQLQRLDRALDRAAARAEATENHAGR